MTTITSPGDQSSVRVVLRRPGGPDEELELTLHHPAATAADLADALRTRAGDATDGRRPAALVDGEPDVIRIDGRSLPPGLPLRAGRLRRGSTVEVGGGPDDRAPGGERGPRLMLRTVAGPDAGRALPLRVGVQVVGRGRDADLRIEDPTLARYQAVVEVDADGNVELTDLGAPRASRIGASIAAGARAVPPGDELVLGATSAVVIRDDAEEVAAGGSGALLAERTEPLATGSQWTVPLHRPPRAPATTPPTPVRVPAAGAAADVPVVAGSAAVVVTLVAGAVVAFVLGQPTFLLLSAVGAAGTLGATLWYRGKHHARRRAGRRRADAELERFARELAAHQAERAAQHRTVAFELDDAVRAAHVRSHELWARRRGDPDAYTAVVGRGEQVVPPLLTGSSIVGGPVLAQPAGSGRNQPLAGEAWAVVEAASLLADVPVTVDLGPGELVGIVGPAPAARALLRSLVLQLVTAHGPADLLVAGLDAAPAGHGPRGSTAMSEASWLAWLPHTEDPAGGERLVTTGAEADAALAGLDRSTEVPTVPHLLLVIEDPSLLSARNTVARRLLSRDPSAAALVLADDVAALPNTCRTVVQLWTDGSASIQHPGHDGLADRVRPAGASVATARRVALALAGLHDPERPGGGRCLPTAVALTDLVAGPIDDADALRDRWRAAGDDPPLRTRLALAADGPVEIDLVRDGPHMLVAGTTGSGKSELLRALIAGLAAGAGPEHLSFVLVDYKGGAAFDACARLPHVAGTATDLDDRLAERALRSLHAELRRREAMLRDVGAPDLSSYRSVPGRPPIPRLVVVVDEFATLAADLPGFIPSLVAVAQRGRSLGVHLVLATQRPAGAVSDDIRANTTIRVALRVQDPADSLDVVGDTAGAAIPRHRPGRAVIRFGPGELVPVQVASVSLPRVQAPGQAVTIDDPISHTRPTAGPAALDGVVAAINAAARSSVLPPRPWLPALPAHVALDDLPPGASAVVDDPDHQAQGPWTWDRRKGHALCIGAVGSGTTTALAALATAAAAATPPAALHLYVVGADPALRALETLPHTGSVIAPGEDERQARLLRHLGRRLTRLGGERAGPQILLVVDRLAGWRADVAARSGPELADLLERILVEGPSIGIVVAGGLDRPGALPLAVSGAVGERLVFRLADSADAVAVGLRPSTVSGLPPGRACLAADGREVQLACPADPTGTVSAVAKHWGLVDAAVRPPAIRCLPAHVPEDELPIPPAGPAAEEDGPQPLALPIGIDGETLHPAYLELHPGDHLLVAGPARSGRSHTLALLARMAVRADGAAAVVALAPRTAGRHPLRPFTPCSTVAELADAIAAVPAGRRLLVVVDDAELVDDVEGVLARLLTGDANVLAAGRTDAIRSGYGHWTQELRRRRRGLLLAPESDLDGDLFGITLPRWPLAPGATGRGYLVMDGRGTLVQVAVPSSHLWDGAE